MRRPALLAVLGVGASVAGTARAQDTGQPPAAGTPTTPTSTTTTSSPSESEPVSATPTKGFGDRGSFLFSVEGVVGLLHQSVSNNGSVNLDSSGFYPGILPVFGTRFGLNGKADSGITYGIVGALAHVSNTGSGNGGTTELQLGPRIGYAGSIPKAANFGYWGRVGPTVSYYNESTGNGSDSITFLDLSFEAFLVYTPVEHFGVLAGPSADIALVGSESPQGGGSNSALYGSYAIDLGLVFDF